MPTVKRRRLMIALLLAFAGAAVGEEADQAMVTYEIAAGPGRISGVSHAIFWSATQIADEATQVSVRVPVASFDSGHAQFDSRMREALQAVQHPFVEVEGTVSGGRFAGTLTLRGVTTPLSMPVRVVRTGRQLVVDTSFAFDLAQFGVGAPLARSRVTVDFVARVSADPRAIESGGALTSN
jgi:polyisoprenoid-binding protein YceI